MKPLTLAASLVAVAAFAALWGVNEVRTRRDLQALRGASERQEELIALVRQQQTLTANLVVGVARSVGPVAVSTSPPPGALPAGTAPLGPDSAEHVPDEAARASGRRTLPVEEVAAAVGQSRRVIEAALASGQWTDQDRSSFAPNIGKLPPEEREVLMLKFSAAINAGKLQVRTDGPPL
jgi:hypothetical protein